MLIQTMGLRKEYANTIAVRNMDLEIPKGVCYGLIGPNGAGKTTTFRMITGLLEPTSGEIVIEDIDVWKDPLGAFKKIGYLPDFFSLYSKLKVWEYLDYFANAYKMNKLEIPKRIDDVLVLVNLTSKKDAFVNTLSRGMQQRLGIAKTIIHNPELIILDEPASGLDPIARKELYVVLNKLREAGKTILISSHILSELAEVCNYVGILEKGNLVKSGAIDEITKEQRMSKKIFIETTDNPTKLYAFLGKIKGIKLLTTMGNTIDCEFEGDDKAVVKLHKVLMAKNFPIITFAHKKKDITDIFMEVSTGEVS